MTKQETLEQAIAIITKVKLSTSDPNVVFELSKALSQLKKYRDTE